MTQHKWMLENYIFAIKYHFLQIHPFWGVFERSRTEKTVG